mmetsp:Transcript_6714/g.16391  ORF Transcript_6714/g.16391 Transcript_6714/m.16391 type:complete len:195 (-) Transcript_6714:47-631(-)
MSADDGDVPSGKDDAAAAAAPAVQLSQEEALAPPEDMELKTDRRQYFHTEGKKHTFSKNAVSSDKKPIIAENDDERPREVGERITLKVEEIHFANPRVRIMATDPAKMPEMMKWPKEKFDEYTLECAQIPYGDDFFVWCAVPNVSNRLLYAMKRREVKRANILVVEAPVRTLAADEDEIDVTYGTSVQGIQLVP